MPKANTLVSIIIPAHNEEKYIRQTLSHIVMQSYKNVETIVVDDGSKDKTSKIVRGYADRIIKLKERKGVSHARNIGASAARGELLIFLDADTLLCDKKAIETILEYVGKGVDYGTCSMKPEKPRHMLYSSIKNFVIEYTKFKASNGIIFIKRDIHEKIGGFNTKKDKEEIFEYFFKAKSYGKFGFVKTDVITSMRKGCTKTVVYWIGVKSRLLKNKPYPIVR